MQMLQYHRETVLMLWYGLCRCCMRQDRAEAAVPQGDGIVAMLVQMLDWCRLCWVCRMPGSKVLMLCLVLCRCCIREDCSEAAVSQGDRAGLQLAPHAAPPGLLLLRWLHLHLGDPADPL